jgi:hypothetical protein
MLAKKEKELSLPFAHGIEIELQVIHKDGTWLRGDEVLDVFDRIISTAMSLLERRIRNSEIQSVIDKYSHSKQTEEGDRGSRVVAVYKNPAGEKEEYTLLGHDPNITSLTWILEVATPPCTTLQELAWWVQTLIAISYEAIPADSNTILISTGLNPTQEYLKNLSFGEHHHILGPNVNRETRIAVYNMIRNFMPHLIALSVNSPFENKKTTDEVYIDSKGRTRAPRCKRSIRLFKNTTQMGPSSRFEMIPYQEDYDVESFEEHVKRSPPRMVDIFPFTEYETVEVRIFDTQLSVPRRIGIAMILQALATKAKKMVENGEKIPDVGARAIAANRDSGVDAGLWGRFTPTENDESSEFSLIYNNQIDGQGYVQEKTKNRFLGDAVASMLFFIRNELEELNAFDDPFMQPILSSIFGTDTIEERTTSADYQLQVFAESDKNMVTLLRRLADITRECCTNWVYDPMSGRANIPKWMKWWTGIEIGIKPHQDSVFAGEETGFNIDVSNTIDKELSNIPVWYRVENANRDVVKEESLSLTELEPKSVYRYTTTFETKQGMSAYNIIVVITVADREIKATKTIQTLWMKTKIDTDATTQFADGRTPLQFSGEIETNKPNIQEVVGTVSVVIPETGTVLGSVQGNLSLGEDTTIAFNQDNFPEITIEPDAGSDVQRCVLGLSVRDTDDQMLAQTTSRPFYLGFVHRGPEILLTTDLGRHLQPGDIIRGEVGLNLKGSSLTPDAHLTLEFHRDSGQFEQIALLSRNEILSGLVGFEWRYAPSDMDAHESLGRIVAALEENGKETAHAVTPRTKISATEVSMNIDSIRVPKQIQRGEKLSGWLRITRNTVEGESAILVLGVEYPEEHELIIMRQPLTKRRNLSVSFGPMSLPKPRGLKDFNDLNLRAKLIYAGKTVDERVVNILLTESISSILRIEFSGVSRFAEPDAMINGALHVENTSEKELCGELHVLLEVKDQEIDLLTRSIKIDSGEKKVYPIPFRIPIYGGMTTAKISSLVRFGDDVVTEDRNIKVKPLDMEFFSLDYRLLDRSGKDIPGLIARNQEINIEIAGISRSNVRNIFGLRLKILSKGSVVQTFEAPIDIGDDGQFRASIVWKTPDVKTVTPFYLESEILEKGVSIPDRGLQQNDKHFTVY